MEKARAVRIWTTGLAGFAVALGINLLILLVGRRILDLPSTFMPTATVGPVVFFTFLGTMGATVTFHALARGSKDPVARFQILAGVVLALSLVPDVLILLRPASMPGATMRGVLLLMSMHVVTAATMVGAFERLAASKAKRDTTVTA